MDKGKAAARRRSAEAVHLRTLGWSYEMIAAELGYKDPSGAYRAVDRALASAAKEPSELVRRQEVARLDMALRAAFEVLTTPHYLVNAGKIVHRITEYVRDPDGGYRLDDDGHPMAAELEVLHDDGPKLAAIDRILKIMTRRARLLGLDAPIRAEAVHPDAVRAEVDKLAAELGMGAGELSAFNAQVGPLIDQWAEADGAPG